MVIYMSSKCRNDEIVLRPPTAQDGFPVNQLVLSCPPLDSNSAYCNLLQCSHFSTTSVCAVRHEALIGFISGYLVPERPDTLFVWQVAVSAQARGKGLASRMVQHLLQRSTCSSVRFIETSITESNSASWALFERLAKMLNAEIQRSTMFDRQKHFNHQHDTEFLVRIGPFAVP